MAEHQANTDLDFGDLGCHLSWIDGKSIPDKIRKSISQKCDLWFEQKQTEQIFSISKWIGFWFSKFVLAHWDGEENEQERWIKQIEDKLNTDETDIPDYHRAAFQYLVQANRALAQQNRKSGTGDSPENIENAHLRKAADLQRSLAMIFCTKAKFIGAFGKKEECVEMFRRVVELDSKDSDYWRSYYVSSRRLRREKFHLEPTTHQEIEIMSKAYRLKHDNPKNLRRMGALYLDIVKSGMYYPDRGEKNTLTEKFKRKKGPFVVKMQWFARQSYELNPTSISSALLLADVLCVGADGNPWRPDSAQLKEAETIFQRCVDEYGHISPTSLAEAGKFFCKWKNETDKGLDLIKQALQLEPAKFSATMHFVRYSGQKIIQEEHWEELPTLLKFIDGQILLHSLSKQLSSKLFILKAVILAKMKDFEGALEAWMEVIRLTPDVLEQENDSILANKKLKDIFKSGELELLRTFINEKTGVTPDDAERLVKLKALLGPAIDRALSIYPQPPQHTRKASAADLDDDWRRP